VGYPWEPKSRESKLRHLVQKNKQKFHTLLIRIFNSFFSIYNSHFGQSFKNFISPQLEQDNRGFYVSCKFLFDILYKIRK
jgi:hypothetical protein